MNIRPTRTIAFVTASILVLAGCGSQNSESETLGPDDKVEITMSGWALNMTPEFEALVDAFQQSHPNITVNLHEYSADDYDTQLTTDLSGDGGPDVITMKAIGKYYGYATSGKLRELGDIAQTYANDPNISLGVYDLDGKYYSLPYRQDSWVIYYNKDMFEKTGVAAPDGTWTWDDFIGTAQQLKEKLPAAGYDPNQVKPVYMHSSWPASVQSFALAQTKDADYFTSDYSWMKPYYQRELDMQDEDLTISFNTATSNKTTYQAQFGTQKAAMTMIGTWYIGALLDQQKSGAAEQFNWGLAPVPQNPETASADKPVTFGNPTGFSIPTTTTGKKLAAAKEFIKWAMGEEGATVLSKIAITPAYFSDKVGDQFFSYPNIPTDELTRKAWQEHDTKLEVPAAEKTAEVSSILNTTHSAILSGIKPLDEAIREAGEQISGQGLDK